MLDGIDFLQGNVKKFTYNFLMMQGSADEVVNNQGALKWYEKVADGISKEKEMFPDMVHELHKEPGKEKVWSRVLSYLSRRTNGSKQAVMLWEKP